MTGDHGGQADDLEARVVELDVAQQEPVDAPGGGEPLVGAEVGRLVADPQHQRVVGAGERALDAGQEAHEERIDLELLERAREQQPDRPRPRLGEPAGVRARRQPSSSAAARIRSRVASPTPGRPFMANETAAADTPARAATSSIVGRRGRGAFRGA